MLGGVKSIGRASRQQSTGFCSLPRGNRSFLLGVQRRFLPRSQQGSPRAILPRHPKSGSNPRASLASAGVSCEQRAAGARSLHGKTGFRVPLERENR